MTRKLSRLAAAIALSLAGFDALAVDALVKRQGGSIAASLSLFELRRKAGQFVEARAVLLALDGRLAPSAESRAEVAGAYERIELRADALRIWESLEQAGGPLSQDGRMRMARLYERLGRQADALVAWRRVWDGEMTAAQRTIVEERILSLASELGRLGDIATQLEAKHLAGRATHNDSSLLIRIYVKAQRQLPAVEAIEEFFVRSGADRVEILNEQARVYRLLKDWPAFEHTMYALAQLDPGRRPEYLRGLILEQIERDAPDRDAKIRRLLADLRESEGESAGGEFEAGVLALAGLFDEAIESYRRATVLNPRLADNYLLLGDALKKRQRTEEAVTQFQRLGLTADTDALVTASVDGLLNALVSGAYTATDKRGRMLLQWAERMLLERLALHGDELYLHRLLADVLDSAQDSLGNFTAVESSLALAAGLRSTILRELIALSTSPQGFDHGKIYGQLKGAAEKRVTYARRLIALRESLPPEVYINAGKEFLSRDDTTNAARAFALAVDSTARPGLRSAIAQIYDEAGLDEEALNQYRLARLADRSDVALMMRLARLFERMDDRDQANGIYAEGLQALLLRQPPRVQLPAEKPGVAGAVPTVDMAAAAFVTREYTLYADIATRGLLITWPSRPDAARTRLAQFEKLFDDELAAVRAAGEKSMRPLLRLDRIAVAVKSLAYATGWPKVADRIDEEQRSSFEDGAGYLPYNATVNQAWGYGTPETEAPARSRFEAALEEASQSRTYEYAANLAQMSGDQVQMLAVARAWAKEGGVLAAVEWADHGRLDARNFRVLCQYALELLRASGGAIHGMKQQTDILERIEEVSGQSLATSAELLAWLSKEIDEARPGSFYIPEESLTWMIGRLTPEHRLELLRKIAAAPEATYMLVSYWRGLARVQLDAKLTEEGPRLVLGALERSKRAESLFALVGAQLIDPRIDPANLKAQERIAQGGRERMPGRIDFFRPLALLRSGQTAQALDAYLEVLRESSRHMSNGTFAILAPPLDVLRDVFLPRYQDELRQRLDALQRRDGLNREIVHMRIWTLYAPGSGADREAIAFLEKAVELTPQDEMLLARLQSLYQSSANTQGVIATLERLHHINPNEPLYRAYLFIAYLNSDRPLDALRLNQGSPEDMSDPAYFENLNLRESLNMRGNAGSAAALLAAPEIRVRTNAFDTVVYWERLRKAIAARDEAAIRRELRRLWQRGTPLEPNGFTSAGRQQILATVVPAARPADSGPYPRVASRSFASLRGVRTGADTLLFEAIAAFPFAAGEFEDFLRAAGPLEEPLIQPLYGFLASAYERHGMAAAKFAALDDLVKSRDASMRDISLWLALLSRQSGKPDTDSLLVLDRKMRQPQKVPAAQLSLIAEIYAKGGRMQHAADVYRLKAARLLRRQVAFDPTALGIMQPVNAASLIEESAQLLDSPTQAAFVKDVVELVRPRPGASAATVRAYHRFLVAVGAATMHDAPVGLPAAEDSLADAGRRLDAGDIDGALRALRSSLNRQSVQQVSPSDMQSAEARALREYLNLLGMQFAPQEELTRFGERAEAPVLLRIATALQEWRSDPQLDPDRRTRLLTVTAYRLARSSEPVAAQSTLARVSEELKTPAFLQQETIALALDVANALGQRLSLSAEQALLATGKLETAHIAGVIERTATEEGVARALELGERAAAGTQDDKLLAVLADLARQTGHEERAKHWRVARAEAAQARAKLDWN